VSSKKRGKKYHRAEAAKYRHVALVWDAKAGCFVAGLNNDHGPPEREQHLMGVRIVDRTVNKGGIVVGRGALAVGENMIDRLREKGMLGYGDLLKRRISAVQWIRGVFSGANLTPSVTARYKPQTSKGPKVMTTNEAQCLELYNAMWDHLRCAAADMIEHVVCFDHVIPTPLARSLELLTEGLDEIARWQRL
jgi:hypothetical protein